MSQKGGSYLSAQPGFLNSGRRPQPPQSWLVRWWREEITNPNKFWGNVAVGWSVAFFGLGVIFMRKAGWLLAPVF
ncbi:hypothetical protein MOBT1_000474 [Malassezia obtusa]|uniref:Uncharacterized protein n=1 Tax=Malassezia obtusa TaxID=76774 RepID=A0AAF0DY56_9BASI|nr:hypothetical protein MOBT1_000474 [Malassezia obtusa]